MFLGHFGIGLAAKPIAKKLSLGTLFMAAQFIDLLWPIFLILGIEQVKVVPGITKLVPMDFVNYPWSHSLALVLLWSLLFGGVHYLRKRDLKHALILGALVLSHWLLDYIVHRPDLPLFPGSQRYGLDLWDQVTPAIVLEFGIYLIGAWLYIRSTTALNRKGSLGLIGLIALLIIIHVTNLTGPPPPDSPHIIGIVGLLQWLFIWLGYWVDRNRQTVEARK